MPTLTKEVANAMEPNFPTIRDNERAYLATPADVYGFPPGWTVRHVPSPSGIRVENIFYSPQLQLRFRSKVYAKKFLDCLQRCNGNEAAATHLYKRDNAAPASMKKKSVPPSSSKTITVKKKSTKSKKTLCSHSMCKSIAVQFGKCRLHGPRCAQYGCALAIFSKGYCKTHGIQQQKKKVKEVNDNKNKKQNQDQQAYQVKLEYDADTDIEQSVNKTQSVSTLHTTNLAVHQQGGVKIKVEETEEGNAKKRKVSNGKDRLGNVNEANANIGSVPDIISSRVRNRRAISGTKDVINGREGSSNDDMVNAKVQEGGSQTNSLSQRWEPPPVSSSHVCTTSGRSDRLNQYSGGNSVARRKVVLPAQMRAQLISLIPQWGSSESDGVAEGDILSKVRGFVAACQGVATEQVLKHTFPNEIELITVGGKTRYFLRKTQSESTSHHNDHVSKHEKLVQVVPPSPPSNVKTMDTGKKRSNFLPGPTHDISACKTATLESPVIQGTDKASDTSSSMNKVSETSEINNDTAISTSCGKKEEKKITILSDEMKARIISYVTNRGEDGARVKHMKSEIGGFSEICQGINAHDMIKANLSRELKVVVDKKTRYFLRDVNIDEKHQEQHVIPSSIEAKEKRKHSVKDNANKTSGKMNENIEDKSTREKSQDKEDNAVILTDEMKAHIISYVTDKGWKEGVRAKRIKSEIKGFSECCQGRKADDVLKENLSKELVIKFINEKTRYFPNRSSQIKVDDTVQIKDTDAMKTKFPIGCQVVTSSSKDCITIGMVTSVHVPLGGSSLSLMYRIKSDTVKNSQGISTPFMIDEKALAYAPATPVYLLVPNLEEKSKGVILEPLRDSNGLSYSVMVTSNNGNHAIHRNVLPQQLSFRTATSPTSVPEDIPLWRLEKIQNENSHNMIEREGMRWYWCKHCGMYCGHSSKGHNKSMKRLEKKRKMEEGI